VSDDRVPAGAREEPAAAGSAADDPGTYQPPRPRSADPLEIGFTPRKPVPWLAPFLLISTGIRTLLAMLFGAYLDKRELQNAFDARLSRQVGPDGGLWLDYVADPTASTPPARSPTCPPSR
jgi:hypothetical protein